MTVTEIYLAGIAFFTLASGYVYAFERFEDVHAHWKCASCSRTFFSRSLVNKERYTYSSEKQYAETALRSSHILKVLFLLPVRGLYT